MIRTVAETGSTNADLLALAASGVEEGVWLRAERQTAGRGRQGRAWVSPPAGNLYASTLVRLRPGDPPAATLALVCAIAAYEAVALVAPNLAGLLIKWPNDLLIGREKLAGILLERTGDAVVAGFGVNLAEHPQAVDRPATSLAAHGFDVTAEHLVELLADRMAWWLGVWRREGLPPIRDCWTACAHPVGVAVTARLADGSAVQGLFEGIDGEGALRLRLADGATRVIHAGDVFLI